MHGFTFVGDRGNGVIVSESREVGLYRGLEVSSALELEYEPAEAIQVEVRGDSNLVPLVFTEVREGRLLVAVQEGRSISPTQPLRVRVAGPVPAALAASGASRLDARLGGAGLPDLIEASGASRVTIREVVGETGVGSMRLQVEGASQVTLEGRIREMTVEASGASRVMAGGLACERARLELSGASHVEIAVSGRVEGEASGASRARILGGPTTEVAVAHSGASSVERIAASGE